ncbi:AraC family transcriptional regulator [Lachnospiraceae bacterium YH-ros2228]|jgi:AraC-like DNA-binding protein|nr:AraC family transcriptional regulator [Lachnospiraceae bacterium]MDD6448582.1 AraC family transcriptional regulator [Lachnospiraceae bacterium]MDD6450712.1 AraC family transcriptional regulator [Lachnospiraceae bacterium]MDD6578454.1 AraC family transcriptional regulator [Lachnospiraceae bacterium]
MTKQKKKLEFRYYTLPEGDYVLPMLGKGWEQEYGLGYGEMQHFHNYLEIGYCYYGNGRLLIEDRSYRYGANMFTIIPANIPHTTISDPGHVDKWEFLFIDLDEFIKNEMESSRLSTDEIIRTINKRGTLKTKANHPALSNLIQSIIRECRTQPLYYKDAIKGYLMALTIEILRLDDERLQVRKVDRFSEYIKTAVRYVNEHYSEEIRISEMASTCGLSESHFRKIFEEAMNMKPNDYINSVRIQEACKLMRKEELSMEELGLRVGYQTPSTFNRNFRKLTGKTPYQWKSDARSHKDLLTDFRISAEKGWEGKV